MIKGDTNSGNELSFHCMGNSPLATLHGELSLYFFIFPFYATLLFWLSEMRTMFGLLFQFVIFEYLHYGFSIVTFNSLHLSLVLLMLKFHDSCWKFPSQVGFYMHACKNAIIHEKLLALIGIQDIIVPLLSKFQSYRDSWI